MREHLRFRLKKGTTPEQVDNIFFAFAESLWGSSFDKTDPKENTEQLKNGVLFKRIYLADKTVTGYRISIDNGNYDLTVSVAYHEMERMLYLKKRTDNHADTGLSNKYLKLIEAIQEICTEDAGFEQTYNAVEMDERIERLVKFTLNEKVKPGMPLIVMPVTNEWTYDVDPWSMGKRLAGQVHVIADMDKNHAKKFAASTGEVVKDNGVITVIFPGEQRPLYYNPKDFKDESDCIETIAGVIRVKAREENPVPFSSWAEVLAEVSKSSKAEERTVPNDVLEETEELLSIKEHEIQKWKKKFEESERKRAATEAELTGLKRVLANEKEGILFRGNEQDYYQDEAREIVVRALKDAYQNSQNRVKDVLEDLIQNNRTEDNGEKIKAEIKSAIIKDTAMNDRVLSSLAKLSLTAVNTGKHYKFTWHEDPRYMIVISSTPSKRNAQQDEAQEFIKVMFT